MRQFVVFTVSGLTTGGIYAITAGGLTLTYATTGVFNFAHGAIGMVAAFLYWQLREGWGVPTPFAFIAVLLVAAPAMGLAVERVVVRRVSEASEAIRLVVTVALMLGLVSLASWVWDPGTPRSVRPLWPGRVLEIGIVRLPYDDIVILVVSIVVAVGLRALLYRTRIGVAMRAGVDDPKLARLTGARPRALAQWAWLVGAVLASLAGMLVAPKLTMSPLPLTLLVVNAYAASVIGRLRSLPMTFAGALVLGLANDYVIGYVPKIQTGQQYLRGALGVTPVLVLFVALLVRRSDRVGRRATARLGEITPRPSRSGIVALAGGVVTVTVVLSTVLSAGDLFNITKVWGLAIVALSMVPLIGYAGQLSLCQLSFGAVGAVIAGHVGRTGSPLALLAAAIGAAVVGALVALPALRLSGIHLALATAAVAVAFDRWLFNLPPFTVFGYRVTIFETGSITVRRPRLGPIDLAGDQAFFIAGAVAFAACASIVAIVRRSRAGAHLLALRDSPAGCGSVGIDCRIVTLAVFTGSAAMAGFGGALYGMGLRSASAGQFEFVTGTALLLALVVGGVRSIGAAVFAGAFLGGPTLANLFPGLSQLTSTSIALSAIAIGTNPNGVVVDAIRPLADRIRAVPALLAGASVVLVALWSMRLAGALDNTGWALTSALVLVLLDPIARTIPSLRRRPLTSRRAGHGVA